MIMIIKSNLNLNVQRVDKRVVSFEYSMGWKAFVDK